MTELVEYQPQSSAIMPVMSIAQAVTRHQQMVGLVRTIMEEGIDFGIIPGTNKPSLLKPGAEKLTTFFGLVPRFEIVKEVEVWGSADQEAFFYYWVKCQLLRHGEVVGEADGSCNSHEGRYRWRWVLEDDLLPGIDKSTLKVRAGSASEFAFAVDKAETSGKYGKPPEYWQAFKDAIADETARQTKRKTAKGGEYDAWEIDSTVYRVPNEDIASLVNTILKMAQKRALIAATLITVNASEFFTQDMEDIHYDMNGAPPSSEKKQAVPVHWIDSTINGQAVRPKFWAFAKEALTEEQVYEALGVTSIHDYTGSMDDAKEVILGYIDTKADAENVEDEPVYEEEQTEPPF